MRRLCDEHNMTKFSRSIWPTALPLVAILRGITTDEAVTHASALLDAGFDCIEVPTNSPDWAASVRAITVYAGDRALVGAGTVLSDDHLAALHAAGGRLAVSPHTDTELVARAVAQSMFVLPGAMTASEIFAAWRSGAHAVKLFPAVCLGCGYVRALRAVLPPELALLAVGGINPGNLADYLQAGCTGAGLGNDLYSPGQSPQDTGARARAFVTAWQDAQS
jgi:2-dehydro-3-deoxyphosphogalactonate aldolase